MERLRRCLLFIFFLQATYGQDSGKPTLEIKPKTVLKDLGSNVYIQCNANVPNKDLVTDLRWEGPNGAEIPSYDRKIQSFPSHAIPNSIDLLINSLTREDTGLYRCLATYASNQQLESEVKVSSYMAITFQDVQPKQTPIIHTDAKIKCVVNSDPAPLVDWLKDGKAIRANDPHYITQSDGILIKNITEADEGVYRCRAKVAELGDIKSIDIQVEVHIPPMITLSPEDVAGKEKESVTFQCIAKGKPAPKYSWVNKDREVLNKKEGYYVDEVTGELQIMDLRPEYTGNYICTAENQAGEVTAEAHLTVLTKPKVEEYKNITVGMDDNAIMRCILTGDPLPEAVFKKDTNLYPFVNGVNDDSRIEVVQTEDDQRRRIGLLKIEGARRSDDGLYTCKGVSGGGETEVWGHITIEFRPTFEDQPQDEFWSWEQQAVNMSCLATSIPNATVTWYLRNEPIREEDPNFRVLSRGPNGILNVTPRDGSYFDTYTCRATNSEGTADHDVILKQVEKPGPVSSATVSKSTATTVNWIIRPPINNGGLEVKGYEVQYKLEDSSWDNAQHLYWIRDSTYVVDELIPTATYIFRFAAKNDVGIGAWSGDKSVTMPKRNVPEEPLLYGAGEGQVKNIPYPHHYDLQWSIPADNGEEIDFFQIVYYKVDNSSGRWNTVGKKKEVDVKYPDEGSKYTIENLNSDSNYKIELRAHNQIGFSLPAEMVIRTRFATVTSPVATSDGTDSLGLIIGLVIIGVIILLVFIDVTCFFVKNKGVTASLVNKFTPAEKDKEAMLEEANVNASAGTEGKGSKEGDKAEEHNMKKEAPVTETTPMINGEDKEAILKEEKEILKEEEMEQKKTDEKTEMKNGESKGSLSKDSPV